MRGRPDRPGADGNPPGGDPYGGDPGASGVLGVNSPAEKY